MPISQTYSCHVYGASSLIVEPGIGGMVSFETVNDEGDQLAAVLIDKEHALRLAKQLIEICELEGQK